MHVKVFSEEEKLPAAIFNTAKKFAAKIQDKKFQVVKLDAAKISISCAENAMRRNY